MARTSGNKSKTDSAEKAEQKTKAEKSVKVESDKGSAAAVAAAETQRGLERLRDGVVVSNKMNKTVVVAITRQVKHAVYGKYIKKTSKHYAHDEKNECQIGDLVRIVETRPMSRLKRWRVQKVINRASL